MTVPEAAAYNDPMIRRRAFTIVEVLVAVAVVGILAAVVTVNVTSSRRTARDANRRATADSYTTALEQWKALSGNGSYFVQSLVGGGNCVASNPDNDPAVLGAHYGYMTGAGTDCVGFLGGGAGRMTRKNIPGKYGAISIADALKNAGVLNAIQLDPSVSSLPYSDDANTINNDYILTTCDNLGYAAMNNKDATEFTVYTNLENPGVGGNAPGETTHSCGGPDTPNGGWNTIQ